MQLTHMHYLFIYFIIQVVLEVQKEYTKIIIYVNISLVTELLQYGIVFLTLLLMQSPLIYLKIVWIDYGLIRNLNLIGMLTMPELEAEV